MDDIRVNDKIKKINDRTKLYNFIGFFVRNWKKILIFVIVIFAILFPSLTGDLISGWIRDFVTPFIQNLRF